MRFPFLALAALAAGPASAPRLTLERLHADPTLSGPSLRKLKLSPDGTRVTFLRGKAEDRFQFDLWEFCLADRSTHLLIDSNLLTSTAGASAEEQARRERERTAGFSGILDYDWAADGRQLLLPVAGVVFLVDLADPAVPRRVAAGNVSDAKISPQGGFVSYVRGQNLHVYDLRAKVERCLTNDGQGSVHNAEAEFVAQEEMAQTTGYYWAPDDSAIAYKRFDETPVPVVRRVEIFADRTDVVEQRYPAAGDPNVSVQLHVVSPLTGVSRRVDLGSEQDIYLVRADWSADGTKLLYQRQSRDQKRLDLVAVDAASLAQQILLSETSATWVNLHDDLRFLKQRPAFLWSSERSGRKHLYLYGLDGKLLATLSSGAWGIDEVVGMDEQNARVYVASNRDAVCDKQVYALALDGSNPDRPQRVTRADGWHEVQCAANGTVLVDTFSAPATPPQVSVRAADGALVAWLEKNEIISGHPYAPYRSALLTPEFGTIEAEDGQTLHYALTRPAAFDPGRRYPVFVETYGGPQVQYVQRKWAGDTFGQYMAQQGYVVFRLDNRGSARRERAFTDAIHGRLGKAEVADQMRGIDWLASQPFVDAGRIGVFGWSYGGFMTVRLLAAASDKIAIGVAVAPVTDWALYDTHYTERFMGAVPGSDPAAYRASGVYADLDGLRSLLLLVHGMADDNVLFTNATRLIDALVDRNVQFELMAYPGARHGISSRAGQRHVFGTIENFFRKNIGSPKG